LTRAWLEQLEPGSIRCWGDLCSFFVGLFQGMYIWTENSWDLRNYRQRANETFQEYIQCSSKKCNELSNITDANMINAFICGTTYEALIHVLGRETPRTMRELLDVATQYATSEAAV
jgi:hypothetical protein